MCDMCDIVICHVGALSAPDLALVEGLARIHLTARRSGKVAVFCHAPRALVDLIELAGLGAILRVVSVVEPGRQPEQRKQPIRAEEGVHGLDLPG
jgi:hypothetical protein